MDGDVVDSLKRFSLMEEELVGVTLDEKDVVKGVEESKLSLFGKLHGLKKANFVGFKIFLNGIWFTKKSFQMRELGMNLFQFVFQSEEDKNKIFKSRVWTFGNQYILLKEWGDEMNIKEEDFRTVNLWVQFWNLPNHWISTDTGLEIGKLFSEIRDMMIPEFGSTKGRFIKVLVPVNLYKPLLRGTNIKLGDKKVWIDINLNEGQFGDWLLAEEGLFGNKKGSGPGNRVEIIKAQVRVGETSKNLNEGDIIDKSKVIPIGSKDIQLEQGIPTGLDIQEGVEIVGVPSQVINDPSKSVKPGVDFCCEGLVDSLAPGRIYLQKGRSPLKELKNAENGRRTKRLAGGRGRGFKVMSGIGRMSDQGDKENVMVGGKRNRSLIDEFYDDLEDRNSKENEKLSAPSHRIGGHVELIWEGSHCNLMEFEMNGSNATEWAVFVYASVCHDARRDQWNYLCGNRDKWGDKWMIIGDFNDILCVEEKRGGRVRSEVSFNDFRNFVRNMGMGAVPFSGYGYTWSNLRANEGFLEEPLDRAFGSPSWMLQYPLAEVKRVVRHSSDHLMLILISEPDRLNAKKRFSFDRRWVAREGADDVVRDAWMLNSVGTPMFLVHQKIRNCRLKLLAWNRTGSSNSAKVILETNAKLNVLSGQRVNKDWRMWESLKGVLNKAYGNEELFWKQKSRNQWLREGDRNTKFFQASVIQRQKMNCIDRLVSANGELFESREDVVKEITGYYGELFSSSISSTNTTLLEGIPCSISHTRNLWLSHPLEHGDIQWVSQLICDDGKRWNIELLHQLFNAHEVAAISKTPICWNQDRDRFFCRFTDHGKYSVHSAYQALCSTSALEYDVEEGSRDRECRRKYWAKIWKLKIKLKIKHFLWKCIHDSLPVLSNIKRRGIKVDATCGWCGDGEETLEHVLFTCERAKLVWKLALVNWECIIHKDISFKEWWMCVSLLPWNPVFIERINLSTYLLWWLWKTRNTWQFQKVRMSEKEMITQAHTEWLEFDVA
ncbi:hypothetical protein DH2020_006065 [Rehmannia glutinosa]|uniref:Reverse transcriptase zinc-binding domain-containing protein n=1 Tax=Rehmannia glutinosa TaxID=99300 RepID=A0ABR0XHX9_REHGL